MMSPAYLQALATQGATLLNVVGLVNDRGDAVSSRLAPAWAVLEDGTVRLAADLTFQVSAGSTVAGWRTYSASTGGTDYGGAELPRESYNNAGKYTLLAGTSVQHRVTL